MNVNDNFEHVNKVPRNRYNLAQFGLTAEECKSWFASANLKYKLKH